MCPISHIDTFVHGHVFLVSLYQGAHDISPVMWEGQILSWSQLVRNITCGIPNTSRYCISCYRQRLTISKYVTHNVRTKVTSSQMIILYYHYENYCDLLHNNPHSILMLSQSSHMFSNMYSCVDLISHIHDNSYHQSTTFLSQCIIIVPAYNDT